MTTGGCLCGGVRWSTSAEVRNILECHCHRCRRLTGNHMAASAAPTDELDITGDALRWYSPDDDPDVGYGFCSTCGSTLFFRSGLTDGINEITSICVGTFDADHGRTTTEIWFADDAQAHIRLPAPDTGITLHRANG